MLVSDDDLAGEPHTSSTLSHEDDISEADSDNITKDYETFRSITAKKLYGVSLPELEAEDDYDDDDDEGFWCSGPRGCIPNFDPEAQGPFKGKDDLIEAWIRDCTANLSVR